MNHVVRPNAQSLDDPRVLLSHPDASYEVVDGHVVELPPVGIFSASVATAVLIALGNALSTNPAGRIVAEGVFILDTQRNLRRRPDVAFVSFARWPAERELPEEGDWEVVPDLAIEVVSPNDMEKDVLRKVREYFEYGARQVWTVHPSERLIYVYSSPRKVRIYGPDEEIANNEVLPGLRLPIEPLFRRTLG